MAFAVADVSDVVCVLFSSKVLSILRLKDEHYTII